MRFFSIFLCLVLLSTLGHSKESQKSKELLEESVTLGFYNLHNLFDSMPTSENGQKKEDWTYLPKGFPGKLEYCNSLKNEGYKKSCIESDWTDKKFALKVNQLHKALLSSLTEMPDILAVCEIENETALEAIKIKFGYDEAFITQSLDERGIDVALLFNLKKGFEYVATNKILVDPKLLQGNKTRDILEVQFKLLGKPLSIFVNHWPSQGNPAQNRVAVAQILKPIVDQRIASGSSVVLTGDFNTLEKDRPHPYYDVLFTGKNSLKDVHTLYRKSYREEAKNLPLGTYFYIPKMEWNLLDRFFVSQNMLEGDKVLIDLSSYKIGLKGISMDFVYDKFIGPQQNSVIKNIPFRSNHNTLDENELGYSDHFPILLKLKASL